MSPGLLSYRSFNLTIQVIFKLLLLGYKSLNGLALVYINELLHHYSPRHSLHSSDSNLLVTLKTKLQLLTEVDLLWQLLQSYGINYRLPLDKVTLLIILKGL